MKIEQRALRFQCAGSGLIGIVDVPERPLARGMLILADSSQYRSGSHRQFTLLSRLFAARGVAVMRFDRAGAGDSEALSAPQGTLDIGAAMKELFIHVPEMKESIILAPGDAAGAAALYAAGDARVTGLALLDPVPPATGVGAPPPAQRYGPRLPVDRPLRRALALRHAASRLGGRETRAPSMPPALARVLDGFGGRVLLVCSAPATAEADVGAGRSLAGRHPRSRRVEIAYAASGSRRSTWRDAVAFACSGWLGSW